MVAELGQQCGDASGKRRRDARDLLFVRAQNASLRIESTKILEDLGLALVELESAAGTHPAVAAPYLEEKPMHRSKKP